MGTPHAESIPQPPRLSPPRGAEIALACRRPRTRSYDLEVPRSLWHADDLARGHMISRCRDRSGMLTTSHEVISRDRTALASFLLFPRHGGMCVCAQRGLAQLACQLAPAVCTANHSLSLSLYTLHSS